MSERNGKSTGTSRRAVLGGLGAMAAGGWVLPAGAAPSSGRPSNWIDVLRAPEVVRVMDEQGRIRPLAKHGESWSEGDVAVRCESDGREMRLFLASPTLAVTRVQLRWHGSVGKDVLVLGDAWERSYGDLGWRPLRPETAMPWYFLCHDGAVTHGYGVRVGAGAFAFWQCDAEGISLWLDVRNGGMGVVLGTRTLAMAKVVSRRGVAHESAYAAARSFAGLMAEGISLARRRGRNDLSAVYGSNDWYYAYGKNSAEGILRDAGLVAELAPSSGPRPYTVIDDGWQHPERYGDMGVLAGKIAERGVLPGLWIRPLQASKEVPESWLLPDRRYGSRSDRFGGRAYDPTIPEARHAVLAKCVQAKRWGYELIKHDFSTYEMFGQWGNEMRASPTLPGWSFHDRSVTNAEIVTSLYKDLRVSAGEDTAVLGCNVIGHLSAGVFDLQRTGDDVSGRNWERTRRMGVNTLAFRLPQHRTFFLGDADCVPITQTIPWILTERWLQAVAESGTALLISPEPGAIGNEQRRAIREAFAVAASAKAQAEPEDWLTSPTPAVWRQRGAAEKRTYAWMEAEGASPFDI